MALLKVYISLRILAISEKDINCEHIVTVTNSVGAQNYMIQFKSERYLKLNCIDKTWIILSFSFVLLFVEFVCVKTLIRSVFYSSMGVKSFTGVINKHLE